MPRKPAKRHPDLRQPIEFLGRPPLEVTRDVTKRLRMTAAQEAAQTAAAKREGLTWSAWALAAFERALARGSTR